MVLLRKRFCALIFAGRSGPGATTADRIHAAGPAFAIATAVHDAAPCDKGRQGVRAAAAARASRFRTPPEAAASMSPNDGSITLVVGEAPPSLGSGAL
ncbi:hypothetical protein [Glycomyces albidus]|uniref:Uncharacterized protein n=1 Tax=Glycomyces albidus TaxID=2656774 RepID=A0A6L5GEI8_9ACTN|nr:hypothetical protein [Glycomyces albidus]MQM28134.1 hypothetical protein [Glycomyces albidus]